MGLDTSHGCWHGSYSLFGKFRESVARAAGIPLGLMQGFYDRPDARALELGQLHGWVCEVSAWLPLAWSLWDHDAICTLLNHSDCDGEIAAEECGPLADRLEQLVPLMDADWRGSAIRFVAGLRYAAERGEPVEFR